MANLLDSASILLTPTATNNGSILAIQPSDGSGDMTFSRGSSATRVNEQGLVENVASNLPRIDYTDGCGSWLLEPQSTNLFTYSEAFDSAYWTKQSGIVLTSNSTISPDGTNNATKVTGNGTTGIYTSANATGLVSRSIYIKSVVGNVNVVLKDPTLTVTSKSVLVTENWQRFELVENNGHANLSGLWVNEIPSSGIYIWGAQLEQNSYATSYTPTQGASSTRLADIATNSGIGSLIGQTEGTIYLDFKVLSEDEINANIFNTNKNTTNAIAVIRTRSNKKIQVQTFFNSVIANYVSINPYDVGDKIKLAFKYKSGDIKLYINGVLQGQSTSTFTISSSLSEINLADNVTYFARKEAIDFTALAVYKTALTDAQLTALTTI